MDTVTIYGVSLPFELILLLTYVPLLITLVATIRYVLGIKTFGVYAPIVLSFAYYYLESDHSSSTGLKYGILLTGIIIISATIFHNLISKLRMHYLTKISLIYTGVVLGLILITGLLSRFYPGRLPRLIPLPILMIATITDRFVAYQIKKGFKTTLILTLESVLIGVLGYVLLKWGFLSTLLTTHPEILILVFVYNLILGQYTGFRLTEFLRFGDVFSEEEEEEEREEE
ncbi:hypothetical protein JW962_01530 [Candidatus Dojkabacteria bacterium]|nr:hypothetical protein [Candidatus Dojkabacteria bacterium]